MQAKEPERQEGGTRKAKKSANKHRGDKILGLEMQASGGKLARKSDEIAQTPTQGISAEVTPSAKNSERKQVHYKKSKQDKKKELAICFGQGPRVPAPSQEGTLIEVVVQKRKNRRKQEDRPRGGEGRVTLKRHCTLERVRKGQSKEETTGRGRWAERTGGRTRNIVKEQEETIP